MFNPGAGGYEPYSYNQGGNDYQEQETYDSYVTHNTQRGHAYASNVLKRLKSQAKDSMLKFHLPTAEEVSSRTWKM